MLFPKLASLPGGRVVRKYLRAKRQRVTVAKVDSTGGAL